MESSIRVELPISSNSKIIRKYKLIGDLRKHYPNLAFVKYIYLDPADEKMKGANPPDNLPLVAEAYITIVGNFDDVIRFATDATKDIESL